MPWLSDILGNLVKQVYRSICFTLILLLLNPVIVGEMWAALVCFLDTLLVDVYLS